MRKILLFLQVILLLGFSSTLSAQSAAGYTFVTGSNGSLALDMNSNAIDMSTGTTTLIAAGLDAKASPVTSIGFNFNLMGTTYTQFSVNEDGVLQLGSTVVGTNVYVLTTGTTASPKLSAFNADFRTGTTTGKIHYKVVGSSPNSVLVVEFSDMQIFYTSTAGAGAAAWQMRLYENGTIEYVYGNVSVSDVSTTLTPKSMTIGFYAGSSVGYFAAVSYATHTSSTSTFSANTPVAAVGPITEVSSAADGSRRYYRYLPPAPCVAPTAQPTALSLTPAATSVYGSFTASSPVSDRYLVVRTPGTDALNTLPVNGTAYVAGNTLGNGTIVSFDNVTNFTSTGLTLNTAYKYTIFSANSQCSGGPLFLSALPLIGNATTNSQQTYTWSGTAADGNIWGTATNWNPSRTVPDVTDSLIINTSVAITAVPTQTIQSLMIVNGSTVSLATATASKTLTINGLLSVPSSNVFTLATGSFTVGVTLGASAKATIDGTLNNGGSLGSFTAVKATFGNSSSYYHNIDGGTIPTATYALSSTIYVTGVVATAPTPPVTIGGNLVWNCPSQTATAATFSSTLTTLGGTFTLQSTGTGAFQFGTSPALIATGLATIAGGTLNAAGGTLTFNGGLNVSGGTITGTSGGSANTIINVTGNLNLSSGTISDNVTTYSNTYNITGNFNQTGGTISSSVSTSSIIVLNVTGSFNQSATGVITQSSTGSIAINFTGTSQQAVTLNGTNTTGIINYRVNNGNNNGIALTGTLSINNGASLTISIAGATPIVGGSITYNTTASTLIYNGTAAQTITANEFPAAAGPTSLTINNSTGVTMALDRTIPGTLTMTNGALNIGANNLTIGTSASAVGTLSWTAGTIQVTTGTLTRWFGTTGLPITAGTAIGYFPLASGLNNRNVSIYFSVATALSAGGTITVGHVDGNGTTAVSILDGAYTIEQRTNAYWPISQNGLAATGTISARITGGGLVSTAGTNLRLMQSAAVAGTFVASSGTNPNFQVNRTGLGLADISQNQYIGAANADISFASIVSGAWEVPSTWNKNVVPTASDAITIASGTTVTVNATTANALSATVVGTLNVSGSTLTLANTLSNSGTITVSGGALNVTGASTTGITNASGATLTISGGTVSVGTNGGGNNRTFANAGTFNLSSTGLLNVYGNFLMSAGAFNQTGGSIVVDGNDNNTAATSVATGTSTFVISGGTPNCSAGTITIVDPVVNTYTVATGTNRSINIPLSASTNYFTGTHTFILGDGISTTPGNTDGFVVETYSSGYSPINNLIVNGGNVTGRWAAASNNNSTSYGCHIKGDLTINTGSEMRQLYTAGLFAVGGNIVNNGTLTTLGSSATSALVLGTNSAFNATAPQSISGSGIFRNSLTASTANIGYLTINNTNGTGVTLGTPISVSGTLTLTAGTLNTTATNLLTLGVLATPSAGTLTYTAGQIAGPFKRVITATTGSRPFPVGTATTYIPASINFTAAPTTAGTLTAEYKATAPGGNGLPLTDGAVTIDAVAQTGYWSIVAGDGLTGGTYTVAITGTGFPGITTPAELRVIKRATSAAAWTVEGTHVAGSGVTASRSGLTTFSEFAIASAKTSNTLPVSILNFKGERVGLNNVLSWTTATEVNNAGFELQRSADGTNFSQLAFVNSKSINGNSSTVTNYELTDTKALIAGSYYRLKQLDKDGKSTLSQIVFIKGVKASKLELVSVYPNPAVNTLNVSLVSPKTDNVTFIVSDLSGKVVVKQTASVSNGDNNIKVNVSNLAKGTYTIKAICADGCETAISKFMKQ